MENKSAGVCAHKEVPQPQPSGYPTEFLTVIPN